MLSSPSISGQMHSCRKTRLILDSGLNMAVWRDYNGNGVDTIIGTWADLNREGGTIIGWPE